MHTLIDHIFLYVLVPVIMLVMFGLGVYLAQSSHDEAKVPARAGMYAGLVAFALYVVNVNIDLRTSVVRPIDFDWVPLAAGGIAGFGLLLLVQRYWREAVGLVGLFVLFLVASSTIATFSYFFASPFRNFAIDFSLATLFGMLLNVIIFPGVYLKLFGRERKRPAHDW